MPFASRREPRLHIARQFTRGGIVLLAGSVTQTAAVAIASILVARLLGPSESGLFGLVLVTINILVLFVGLGVTVTMTRNIAYYVSVGEQDRAVRFAKNGVLFTLLTGLVLAALTLAAAGSIATFMLHRPSLAPYVGQISIIIVAQSLLSACVAASIGWNAMGTASVSYVSQGIARMVASPLLILAGLGLEGAMLGYVASIVFSALVAALLLFYLKLRHTSDSLSSFRVDAAQMVRFGFPPYLGNILNGLSGLYVPLVLALFASNSTIGYFTAANNVTVAISIVSSSTAAALFPAFAGLEGMKADLAGAFRRASKYVGYISIPVIFFTAAAAKQFMGLLYGAQFLPGTGFLVLLALSSLPMVAGLSVIPAFFNGVGKTRITLYAVGLETAVVFVLAPLLGESFGLGVDGTIYAILIANVAMTLVGLAFFRRMFSATVSILPMASTLFSGALSFVLVYFLPVLPSDLLAFVEKLIIFALAYFTVGPATGAVSRGDLNLVQSAVDDMRFIGGILDPLFRYQKLFAGVVVGRSRISSG